VVSVLYHEEGKMRKLLTLCLLAATAVVVPAGAQAAHVHSTLTGIVSDAQGWCCGDFGRVQGVGTVPGVGRVSFVADWLSGCEPDHGPLSPDPECFTDEQLVLTKKNGDTLTLSGGLRGGEEAFDRGGLVVPWSVTGGTGPFASVSGSGTISFTPRLDATTPTATVALTRTLSR
jgi:hypothetical protein